MELTETGYSVFRRTYAREIPGGGKEEFAGMARRVARGNLALVDPKHHLPGEEDELFEMIMQGKIIPAGRQLYMTGVDGRQFLFNCHVSGWEEQFSRHFEFTFLRLMEGGGVGANYSSEFLNGYEVQNRIKIHLYCNPLHENWSDFEWDNDCFGGLLVPDSREGWSMTLSRSINTACNIPHPGAITVGLDGIIHIGFDLSSIRPSGSPIKTFGGTAAGPVPLARLLRETERILNEMHEEGVTPISCMDLDHAISVAVVSGNVRRSARMSILPWDDPYIYEFLSCKEDTSSHWTTNISVAVDADFINYIGDDFVFTTENHSRAALARDVYLKILEGMLRNGEPGIWNKTLSNTGEIEEVNATNPCSEICLEEWEACNLGSVNLAAFVEDGKVDFQSLLRAHKLLTRFLIRSTFGDVHDSSQREVMDRNRRIGVGHLGFHWFCVLQGIKYSKASADRTIISLLRSLYRAVRGEANSYSFNLRIPAPIKVTTVAPTGTTAKMFGVSEGIHPIYAKHFIRRIRFSSVDPDQVRQVDEYRRQGCNVVDDIYSPNTVVVEIPTEDPLVEVALKAGKYEYVEDVSQLSVGELLGVLEMYQAHWADNSISFTCNVTPGEYDVMHLGRIIRTWLPGLKGVTVFPDVSRPLAPYERLTELEYAERSRGLGRSVDSSTDESCASGACPVR